MKYIIELKKAMLINNIFLLFNLLTTKKSKEPIIFPIEENKKNRPNLKSSIWRLFFISIDEEVKSPADIFINKMKSNKVQ